MKTPKKKRPRATKGPTAPAQRKASASAFWQKVLKRGPNDCWLWTAALQRGGYPMFSVAEYGTMPGHRFSYELHKGDIPLGHAVDHSCGNRACVNPRHLRVLKPRQNIHESLRNKALLTMVDELKETLRKKHRN
jgi:hypothetical protein